MSNYTTLGSTKLYINKNLIPAGGLYKVPIKIDGTTKFGQEVGKKIWVTYNPNDVTEMLFEHHDKDRKYYLGYPAFAKLEKQNIVIRQTGEEAIATILEVEDLELVHSYHKEMKSVLRLKLEVFPKAGEPFQAEVQNTFMNAGLHKYTVGKKVTVKFNPQDKTQVALV